MAAFRAFLAEDAVTAAAAALSMALHGPAVEAEAAPAAYAVSLARLHAATLGCRARHTAIVQKGFPAVRMKRPGLTWIDDTARKVPGMLGQTIPDAELEVIGGRLQSPGPWLTLAHRDSCPDDVPIVPDGTALGTAQAVDIFFLGSVTPL